MTPRIFAPLPKDHPLVVEKEKCPVCKQEFKEGDQITLVPIQAMVKRESMIDCASDTRACSMLLARTENRKRYLQCRTFGKR